MMLESEGVPAEERRLRIAATVEKHGFVHIGDLAEAFGISRVTVRADLDSLEKQGRLHRVRGGALATHRTGLPASRAGGTIESTFEEALDAAGEEKAAIGLLAAQMVSPGESVILDAGTTTLAVAEALVARADLRDVVVITNGLSHALVLEQAVPRYTVVVSGGTLRPLQHSLINPLAGGILGQINADTVFLGCNGVHPSRGVTNLNLPEAEMKQLMMRSSARTVVVADGSKIGRVELAPVCQLDQADVLVTGRSADERVLQECRDTGLEVEVADER
ncbi:DeoR/GlpR family DNA-binding transcription regulator [Streptomyces sp. NPDC059787]|uniref:DeoR/GlpR family DNA-binding transcription regulator n=1 Tax=Streptomyces sp. NPDC059787 TaxID=3346947 RepID=UPI0036498F6A